MRKIETNQENEQQPSKEIKKNIVEKEKKKIEKEIEKDLVIKEFVKKIKPIKENKAIQSSEYEKKSRR